MIILSPFQQGAFSRRLPEKDIERIPCPPPAARGLRRRSEQGISHYVKILCPESVRDRRVLHMDGSGYSCWLLRGLRCEFRGFRDSAVHKRHIQEMG
jgi:hypothetical protein